MDVSFDLTIAWTGLLLLAVYIYVVLDGFDLGVGILFALFPGRSDRDLLMNTIAPVWDGNETWLILGGGGLFAAFPLAYAIMMPALYAPVIALLLALVFRGVAFEFRWRTERWRKWWDRGFIFGSLVATFAQGVILGAVLQGIEVADRAYGGGWWDWLSIFSVTTGLALVVGYTLLGATWLLVKTEGEVHARARRLAWGFALGTLAFIGVVSLLTPTLDQRYFERWFSTPNLYFTLAVPAAVGLLAWALFRALRTHPHDYWPFFLSLALFALCFVGLGISIWPYMIPTEVTIWDAAAPAKSQLFMFVGAVILLPVILGYTAYAYWVFRGKVDADAGYH